MRQRFRGACRELKLSRHCEILEMQQKRKIPPVSLTDGAYFQSGKLQWREPETASCVCTVKVRVHGVQKVWSTLGYYCIEKRQRRKKYVDIGIV